MDRGGRAPSWSGRASALTGGRAHSYINWPPFWFESVAVTPHPTPASHPRFATPGYTEYNCTQQKQLLMPRCRADTTLARKSDPNSNHGITERIRDRCVTLPAAAAAQQKARLSAEPRWTTSGTVPFCFAGLLSLFAAAHDGDHGDLLRPAMPYAPPSARIHHRGMRFGWARYARQNHPSRLPMLPIDAVPNRRFHSILHSSRRDYGRQHSSGAGEPCGFQHTQTTRRAQKGVDV